MKKVLSLSLALIMAVTLIMPFTALKADAAISVRTSLPEYGSPEGDRYYYSDNNVFYKYNYGPNKKYLQINKGII